MGGPRCLHHTITHYCLRLLLLSCRYTLFATATVTPRTTPPTTTPRTTFRPTTYRQDGCEHEGRWYPNGFEIDRDVNNCYGTMCEGGGIIYFDHKCWLDPPPCDGREEQIPGECCKLCHTTPTTTPMTTPKVPPGGCLYNRTVYKNYDVFELSNDKCTGKECHYGTIRPWAEPCDPMDNCNGTVFKPPGQCCKICFPPGGGCYINGKIFQYNEVTNQTDPCRPCKCSRNGNERCTKTQCDTTDCENPYREDGECCYTCGSTGPFASALFILLLIGTMGIL